MTSKKNSNLLSHHASYLVGSAEVLRDELKSLLEKAPYKIGAQANPDFFDRSFETFTIDDARELKSLAETRPASSDEHAKKIFIFSMNGITTEAQNALLKLLEEPPEYAHFFLIMPSAHLLLPTVKSRLSVLSLEGVESNGGNIGGISNEAKDFVDAKPAKRLEMIKDLLDDISKEKKTRQDAIEFLNHVEALIYKKGIAANKAALEAIDTARKYLNDRAPSVKMLLEYVALSI